MEEVYKGVGREVRFWPSSHGNAENYPSPDDTVRFREHLDREGFIVVRGAVPASKCQKALGLFRSQIKKSKYPFLRHEQDICEPHVFTETGFMKYPILNIQDIPSYKFHRSKTAILDLLTYLRIQQAIESAFGEKGQMVQTMAFEGNQNTWPHRDGRYVDSEERGRLLGVIVAAEDIHRGAGRFYICPRSNNTSIAGEHDGPNSDPNGQAYKMLISDFVINGPLECVAPILRQGDMLIWSSMTIHGSLASTEPKYSRSTFNAHWIPASQSVRLMGGQPLQTAAFQINGVQVARFGGQYTVAGKLKSAVKNRFPGLVPLVRATKEKFKGAR